MKNVVRIFYSYSHRDEDFRISLETHLAILKRQGLALDWHDRKIMPGQTWGSEIDVNLNESDIIILLISSDFIASDYCYGKELEQALERHESGNAYVLPIILRPVDWLNTPFAKLQVLPKDGKPVTTWANHDEAWLDITKGVRTVVERILNNQVSRSKPTSPVRLSDLMCSEFERIESLYEGKHRIGGMPTGFDKLDQVIDGIHATDIILIAGRPTMGKSDLALNIASFLTIEMGVPIAFFSMRLIPEHITRRLLSSQSKVPIYRIVRGLFGDLDWPKLERATNVLKEAPLLIYGSSSFTDVELAQLVSKLKEEAGVGLVIIDGIEHISSAHKHTTRNTELCTIVKTFKNIAGDNHIPIILTVTTSREGDMRVNKRPTIRDLDEWDILASDAANIVIFLYRSDAYNKSNDNPETEIAEIIIAKNDYGPTNNVTLAYLAKYCSFENLASNEDEIQG
jgi:replicative DNA helicase